MELALCIAAVIFLVFGYGWLQDRREDTIAKRLERLHGDPDAAAGLIDTAISKSRVEAQQLNDFRNHRF